MFVYVHTKLFTARISCYNLVRLVFRMSAPVIVLSGLHLSLFVTRNLSTVSNTKVIVCQRKTVISLESETRYLPENYKKNMFLLLEDLKSLITQMITIPSIIPLPHVSGDSFIVSCSNHVLGGRDERKLFVLSRCD